MTLNNDKHSGSDRLMPAEEAVPKKRVKIHRCDHCKAMFGDESNYRKHFALYHEPRISEDIATQENVSTEVTNETAAPVLSVESESQTPAKTVEINRQQRSFNCHECDFQSSSPRLLFRHVQSTLHLDTDDMSVKCYNCDTKCKNWNELMHHRKSFHYNDLKPCKFVLSGETCKFKDRCFYRHSSAPTGLNNIVVKDSQDFQVSQQTVPPDPMALLCAQMTNMNTNMTKMTQMLELFQEKNRGQGV